MQLWRSRQSPEERKRWIARTKSWKAKNPTKEKFYSLRWNYKMTLEEYNLLLEKQDNKCAICKQPETSIHNKTKQVKQLAVDHDHNTGKIRGLLCERCNTTLGKMEENMEYLESMISYLKLKK